MNPDEIEQALQVAMQFDFVGAWAAVREGNLSAIAMTAEEALTLATPFFPPAEDIKLVIQLIVLIEKARAAGLWRPGEDTDPEALARDAHDHKSGGK